MMVFQNTKKKKKEINIIKGSRKIGEATKTRTKTITSCIDPLFLPSTIEKFRLAYPPEYSLPYRFA